MNTSSAPTRTALVVARLLERLDASPQPVDARQYQLVARQMADLLADPEVNWQPLLAHSPAAATLYENLHYASAGLCRSPLERAVPAEQLARQAIEAAQHSACNGPTSSSSVPPEEPA